MYFKEPNSIALNDSSASLRQSSTVEKRKGQLINFKLTLIFLNCLVDLGKHLEGSLRVNADFSSQLRCAHTLIDQRLNLTKLLLISDDQLKQVRLAKGLLDSLNHS